MNSRVFTNEDAWNGGSYELALELGPVNDQLLQRALAAVWSFPELDGCFLRMDLEPRDQRRITIPDPNLELNACLRGIATFLPRGPVACSTLPVREEEGADWLYFGLPLGSLARVLPVGAFPFDDGRDQSWRGELDCWLERLARHVYKSVKFKLGLVGWTDGLIESASALTMNGVPAERWVGYLLPEGDVLRWHPPNQGAPMTVGG